MGITRTTRAAPAGTSTATITSASFLAPSNELLLLAYFQVTTNPTTLPTPLGSISDSRGLSWTKVCEGAGEAGGNGGLISLWRVLGNGASGTVTANNGQPATARSDLRVYSFTGSDQLDLRVGGTGGLANGPGGVASSRNLTNGGEDWDLSSVQNTMQTSLNMGFVASRWGSSITFDVRPSWTQVEQFLPTGGGAHQVIERLGPITQYEYRASAGDDWFTAYAGVSIRDTAKQTKRPLPTRGGKIASNWY